MAWVKIDDAFPRHLKVAPLTGNAVQLYVFGLCCSAQQGYDGFLPANVARMLTISAKRHIHELVETGLWNECEGGYQIHDYAEYQPTSEKVSELREKRAEAGRLGGQRSKPSPASKANLKQNAFGTESKTAPKATPKANKQNRNPVPVPLERETPKGVPLSAFAQLEQVFGYRPTGGEAKLWGKISRDLPADADLAEAARRYQQDMPNVVLSAPALAKHYPRLMSPAWREKQRGLVAADFLDLVRSSDDGQGSSSHPRLGAGGVPADADIA